MKVTSLLLSSAAIPLMLLSSPVMAKPLATASEPITVAQASPNAPEELPPRGRPGRVGPGDADPAPAPRGERPDRGPRPAAQERGGSDAPEGRGPRRGAGPSDAAQEAPRSPRAVTPGEAPEAPRPRREPGPPAERPARPAETAPAQPERPVQAPTRTAPPAEAPTRTQQPTAQERPSPAERRRQQAPDEQPRTRTAPAEPATPPATAPQRAAPTAPRPSDEAPAARQRDQRPTAAPPAPAAQPAPSQTAPAPAQAPTAAPRQPTPTAPAPAAPTAQPTVPSQTAPQPPAATQAPTRTAPGDLRQPLDASRVRIEDLRNQRRQRVEDGGRRVIIEEPGARTIIREGDQVIIRHDETERFRRTYRDADVRVERRGAGEEVTIVRRPDGAEIVTVRDEYGNLIRRVRREPAGREVVLIENRRGDMRPGAGRGFGYVREDVIRLAPPVVRIPREEYIVEVEEASQEDLVQAFTAPPVERIERAYTLDEVRQSQPLRERMRRVDLDTITFEFGSWTLPEEQIGAMTGIAQAIRKALDDNPNEVFLVEGHTDAVGSDEDNLTLSDRRAETVAAILSERFRIPAENLTTQGYGEQYLKVNTQEPERENRRVTLRRITPLLQGQNTQQ